MVPESLLSAPVGDNKWVGWWARSGASGGGPSAACVAFEVLLPGTPSVWEFDSCKGAAHPLPGVEKEFHVRVILLGPGDLAGPVVGDPVCAPARQGLPGQGPSVGVLQGLSLLFECLILGGGLFAGGRVDVELVADLAACGEA